MMTLQLEAAWHESKFLRGVGSVGGTPIIEAGTKVIYKRDINGQTIVPKLNQDLLQPIIKGSEVITYHQLTNTSRSQPISKYIKCVGNRSHWRYWWLKDYQCFYMIFFNVGVSFIINGRI
jgi:hypothetical protein